MSIDFFTGFVLPKFEYDNQLTGGGLLNPAFVTDGVTIPYARQSYDVNVFRLMNTGFHRDTYLRTLSASSSKVVASFWLKFDEDFNAPYSQMAESDFFVMRDETTPRALALAVRKKPDGIGRNGRLELWWGNSGNLSSYTGTMSGSTDYDAVTLDTWYWAEIVYDGGAVSIYLDGTPVLSSAVPSFTATYAGPCWESYGFRAVTFSDLILQTGGDAALLSGQRRVTTLRLNSDKITEWPATAVNGSSGYHWLELSELQGYPNWWNQFADPGSYVSLSPGRELYGVGRAIPVGPLEAVCLTAFINPNSASVPSSFKFAMRKGDSGTFKTFPITDCPVYNPSVETTDSLRRTWVARITLADLDGNSWDEADWTGDWQVGLAEGTGPATITALAVERLHRISGGAGARYRVL